MKSKSIIGLIILLALTIGMSFVAAFGIGEDSNLSINNIKLGLDLSGGVSIVYEAEKEDVTADEMSAAVSLIQRRLDRQGFTEGETSVQGENRIRVEIPGVENAEDAIAELGETAQLLFITEEGEVILTGAEVENARKGSGQTSENGMSEIYVTLEFTPEGTEAFANATANNIGKPIYIIMDEEVISAPVVNSAITDGSAIISGGFTGEEADELASRIREGALPFNLKVVEMNNVGARLGANAVNTSLYAAVVGVSLVLIFMLVIYRLSGLGANWALIIYIALDIIILSFFGVTLTLPGIAGIILSVGMAVDANVIIFERIKEEIKIGKSVRSAVDIGFSKALPAIIDGNITTFIAGIVLFVMGTGTIKGFAQTLMIGIAVSMFTAIFITRFILRAIIGLGVDKPKYFGIKEEKAMKEGTA